MLDKCQTCAIKTVQTDEISVKRDASYVCAIA